MSIEIRHCHDIDAEDVSTIVCRNLREVNSKDYAADVIEKLAVSFTPDRIRQLARQREMFVAEMAGKVVGTASLARDNRTQEERYVVLTIFVLPEEHGKGIGTKLMERVEEAARRKGAATLKVPAGRTAISFYQRLGYSRHAPDKSDPDEGMIWMSKLL